MTAFTSCQDCAICMDTIQKPGQALVTECNHVFHEKCLRQWANRCNPIEKRHPDCPLCRGNVAASLQRRRDREIFLMKEIIRLHSQGTEQEYAQVVRELNELIG